MDAAAHTAVEIVAAVAQGASNAVAVNVAGGVDMVAWLLRAALLPVPAEPVGGEAWMRRVGLIQAPRVAWAGAVGEGLCLAAQVYAVKLPASAAAQRPANAAAQPVAGHSGAR